MAWFVLKVKSFDFEVEETTKCLKGCIRVRRKVVTSWIRFEVLSLFRLLVGLEACAIKAWLGVVGKRAFFDSRCKTREEMGYRTMEC